MANVAKHPPKKTAFDVLMAVDRTYANNIDRDYLRSFQPIRMHAHVARLRHYLRRELVDPDITFEEFCTRYQDWIPQISNNFLMDIWWYRMWEQPADLISSLYLKSGKRHHFGPGASMRYDRYTERDLKRFVVQRGLKDPYPPGITLKSCYIRLLRRADREYRFDFMGLPSEMRVMICGYLLSIPRPKLGFRFPIPKLHPSILSTCKQVHQEATGVLYDQNVFLADFAISALDQGKLKRCGVVHNIFDATVCDHTRFYRLPEGIDDYPEFFRRISQLELHLTYTVLGTIGLVADNASRLNHFLYTLASFLMDGHRLKRLHIKVDLPIDLEYSVYEHLFYPLLRLRNVPEVTITGPVPAHVQLKLIRELKTVDPVFNTLRQWSLLNEEATAHGDLLEFASDVEDVEDMYDIACYGCEGLDAMAELSFRMGAIEEAKEESVFDSTLEENFIARLSLARDMLRRFDLAELKRLTKRLAERRETTLAYEQVTDEGRLEEAAEIWAGHVYDDDAKYQHENGDWDNDQPIQKRLKNGKMKMIEATAQGSSEL